MLIISRNQPLERSSEVTFPWSWISLAVVSERISQKRILLSKWPLIIVVPAPSAVTRSLQLEPANFVPMPEIKGWHCRIIGQCTFRKRNQFLKLLNNNEQWTSYVRAHTSNKPSERCQSLLLIWETNILYWSIIVLLWPPGWTHNVCGRIYPNSHKIL